MATRGEILPSSPATWRRSTRILFYTTAEARVVLTIYGDDAETYMNVGEAMGTAMVKMLKADQH
jgi:hypothetical protein